MPLSQLYRHSLALLTDLYQITMAYAYWREGRAETEAVFHLTFRKNPFAGGYAVACGLEYAIEYLNSLQFDEGDVAYLATLVGNDGAPLFDPKFLDYLRQLRFQLDIDAIPEGTVVFPHEALIRVKGPILQCQLIETPLLNLINFQTLVATKSARICLATRGEPVLEFGLRRAQGIDGSLAASRAAYVGGCEATSNVLAGKLFGIPVRGTHAHSWIMSFDDELEAFDAYARAMPNNCVFLVDTYDTLNGVRHACTVGQRLRESGHEMAGIRLDSGDLAYLSIEARKILDEAGFPTAKILATNDLDENIIASLKEQGAKIAIWGVGTKLATAYDQPALGGVYKLSAQREGGEWRYKIKLSEQSAKTSIPGVQQVRRYKMGDRFVGDAIYDTLSGNDASRTIVDPHDAARRKVMPADAAHEELLVPIFRAGKPVYNSPPLAQSRQRTAEQLAGLHAGTKRFLHPHTYPAGLDLRLHELRQKLIEEHRKGDV